MKGKTEKLHLWETAALLALSAALCAGAWAQSRQSGLAAGLLRLHVVAVDDSEQEQALKLRVRDAVLACLDPVLEEAADAGQARALVAEHLNEVAAAAQAAAQGRAVTVSLGRERFPTRQYEGFALPAGEYESLRIVLGEGKGHNWWCVVFPPLCVSAAEAEQMAETMAPEDVKLISQEEGFTRSCRCRSGSGPGSGSARGGWAATGPPRTGRRSRPAHS